MDWKAIIGAVAPTLGTALLGPLGGVAASIAGRILLGNDKATSKDVQDFITANQSPEIMAKLKEIEAALKQQENELGFKYAELEVKDRQGARDRETALGLWASVGVHILAAIILAGFFGSVYWVFYGELPKDPNKLMVIGTVIGYVSAKADQVVAYFFGSSAGSKDKTTALANALQTYATGKK